MPSHFPSLREFSEGHNHINYYYWHFEIIKMQTSFEERLSKLRKEKKYIIPLCHTHLPWPTTFKHTHIHRSESSRPWNWHCQKENAWKLSSKMSPVRRTFSLKTNKWSDPEKLPNSTNLCLNMGCYSQQLCQYEEAAFRDLSIFGTTYLCEQVLKHELHKVKILFLSHR